MMSVMSGKKPEEEAAPEKAETPADSWAKFVNTLFDTGLAVVRYDGRDGMLDAAIAAVRSAGYSAKEAQ